MASSLKNPSLIALEDCAIRMNIDLKSLPRINEFTLLRALKTKVFAESMDPIPFDELENKSIMFKINYAHHFGISKEEIMSKLGVTRKQVIDNVWYYENKSYKHCKTYKEKIEEFLQSQKAA